jgi:hypothetical protein
MPDDAPFDREAFVRELEARMAESRQRLADSARKLNEAIAFLDAVLQQQRDTEAWLKRIQPRLFD